MVSQSQAQDLRKRYATAMEKWLLSQEFKSVAEMEKAILAYLRNPRLL